MQGILLIVLALTRGVYMVGYYSYDNHNGGKRYIKFMVCIFSCEATQYPHMCGCLCVLSLCVLSLCVLSLVSACRQLCTTLYDYI